MSLPFVSIVIVNYNGAHFLPTCLEALKRQTYPSDRFEVVVSENASTDGSLELLRDHYPWVRVIQNRRNLAFARGNNVAIRATQGKYVVLLNNDTAPTPTWLENLVRVAEAHPEAGMVTSHLQLFYDQLVVTLEAETFTPPQDGRELGVQLFEVDSSTPFGEVQYLEGFYGWEHSAAGRFRWMKGRARLGVPVKPGDGPWLLRLRLAAPRSDHRPVQFKVTLEDETLASWQIRAATPEEHQLELPAETRAQATPLVQNTGSLVNPQGFGRDRGTYVRDFEVFYEVDRGQYGQTEEVFGGCGASLLLRREMLEDVGLFDEDFFMYYEDTDLSWRARLRGWKVLYAPDALVRHIHCGSSGEWSPFFFYHVERNRLAMVFKNARFSEVLRVWRTHLKEVWRLGGETWRAVRNRGAGWRGFASRFRIQLKVLATLLLWLPSLTLKRWRIQRQRRVPPAEVERWFVDF